MTLKEFIEDNFKELLLILFIIVIGILFYTLVHQTPEPVTIIINNTSYYDLLCEKASGLDDYTACIRLETLINQ